MVFRATLLLACLLILLLLLTTCQAEPTPLSTTAEPTNLDKTTPFALTTSSSNSSGSNLLFVPASDKTLLQWAQLLVQNVQPSDTDYQHSNGAVTWAGQHGATLYQSHTDCSGLLNALLNQTYNINSATTKTWLGAKRPLAATYYGAISAQKGFLQIKNIKEVQVGDIIAVKYVATDPGDDTGHIMLVANLPQMRQNSAPLVSNTQQWEVLIIDSSTSGHGQNDTRWVSNNQFRQGIGQGTLRLYADANGEIVGYTWSVLAQSQYYDGNSRPLVIGRLDLNYRI